MTVSGGRFDGGLGGNVSNGEWQVELAFSAVDPRDPSRSTGGAPISFYSSAAADEEEFPALCSESSVQRPINGGQINWLKSTKGPKLEVYPSLPLRKPASAAALQNVNNAFLIRGQSSGKGSGSGSKANATAAITSNLPPQPPLSSSDKSQSSFLQTNLSSNEDYPTLGSGKSLKKSSESNSTDDLTASVKGASKGKSIATSTKTISSKSIGSSVVSAVDLFPFDDLQPIGRVERDKRGMEESYFVSRPVSASPINYASFVDTIDDVYAQQDQQLPKPPSPKLDVEDFPTLPSRKQKSGKKVGSATHGNTSPATHSSKIISPAPVPVSAVPTVSAAVPTTQIASTSVNSSTSLPARGNWVPSLGGTSDPQLTPTSTTVLVPSTPVITPEDFPTLGATTDGNSLRRKPSTSGGSSGKGVGVVVLGGKSIPVVGGKKPKAKLSADLKNILAQVTK